MAYWLLKTEPTVYSYADLDRDQKTRWDGVNNNLALKYIRSVQPGDLALIYHTGNERQAVGIATILSPPYPDPQLNDPKRVVFDLQALKPLTQSVALATIKADPHFAGFELLRLGRLSVVPVPECHWQRIMDLAESIAR